MFQEFFRHRRRSQSDIGKSWNQVRQTVSTIEAIFKFRQVARYIYRIKGMIIAAQGCLATSPARAHRPDRRHLSAPNPTDAVSHRA